VNENSESSGRAAVPRSDTSTRAADPVTPALDVRTVVELLQGVSAESDVEQLVDVVTRAAIRHVGALSAEVALTHERAWALAAAPASGRGEDRSAHRLSVPDAPTASLIDLVFRTKQTAKLNVGPPGSPGTGARLQSDWRVAVPLLRSDRLLGVLCLAFAPRAGDLSPEQVFLTDLLASQAAMSLEHALQRQAADKEIEERRNAAAESERVQSALKESEARFRLMADTTPDIIWITDLDPERVVYVSPSFERVFGRKVADLYANPHLWVEGIHPEDRERVGRSFASWIASGSTQPWEVEFRVLQPTGGIRWIYDRGVFSSEDGGPKRVSGIATDITERREAEAALRESEQRYALAMEAARDGHWDWIAETDDYYASPRMLEIYGFPPDTRFAGRQDFLDRFPFHPDDKIRWQADAAEHFAGRSERFDMEMRVMRIGDVRWVHTTGLVTRNAQGEPMRYTGSVSDVTERKAAEAALRESQERFALATEGASDGIYDWDLNTNQMFMSHRCQQLYGLEPGEAVRPRPVWVAMVTIHPEEVGRQRQTISDYLEGKIPNYDNEWRVLHPDGIYRWIRLRGVCIRDHQQRATRLAGSVTDIDGRRRAEAALRQTQRLEALGTLAGGIAHDFNNILGAILGFGEMSLRDSRAGSRVRRDVEGMLTAAERGRSLVERILAFSRTGIGERVPVQLEAVVKETADMVAVGLPENVEIELELNSGHAAVLGDATQLHQVVMNLASNAIQAMTSGGVLRISLAPVEFTEPRLLTTGGLAVGDYVALSVRDSGCGMSLDVLARIFDPFFTTKEVGSGTGLGLSLVHGIVSEFGGAIDVTTSPGGGSLFTVYLPRSQDAVEVAGKKATPLERGRLEQVLLVDDEEALVQLMTGTLLGLGYIPIGFTAGAEALAAFRAHPDRFDVVVTDERMPGLSGTELIGALREIRPTIPVVMISGYLGAGIERRAREAGADAVLRKPLATAELATALARSLRARETPVLPTAG
jgi:PAS domain S-box-containing protein